MYKEKQKIYLRKKIWAEESVPAADKIEPFASMIGKIVSGRSFRGVSKTARFSRRIEEKARDKRGGNLSSVRGFTRVFRAV